jgi:mono/diheme cytochrome c family protein
VVTIGPATGSIRAGNILYGANDPDGVGVPCATTIFDPAPCPLEGAPLYGLLLEVPPSTTSDGVAIAGRRFVGTNTLTFKVTGLYAPSDILHSNGIELRINDHVHGNGSGAFSVPVTIRRASTTSFQVYVPGPAGTYTPIAATTSLDSEGAKRVPRSCMACHGGKWDPETQTVSGASFLPFDVGRLAFPSTPGQTRADQEAHLAALNALVLKTAPNASNPNDPIGTWIRGTYAGGSTANDAFVPTGWSGDRRLYQRVVGPYCRICHQALGSGLDFSSAAQFRGLAAAVAQATCVNRTMPHAEPTFVRFWQSDAPRVLSQDLLGGARCGP